MNFKMIFPSYRNRFLFVMRSLQKHAIQGGATLHLGCGEGDYDAHIACKTGQLVAGDINLADVEYARSLNSENSSIQYQVLDALDLNLAGNSFDTIIAVDTIEHVGNPRRMMKEISRVLRPGGICILTFPRKEFPITYDPVNFFLQKTGKRPVSQGAYAFNHSYLIGDRDWQDYLTEAGLILEYKEQLSGWLIALLEMYWTGWVQKLFKANSANIAHQNNKMAVRSDGKLPPFIFLTDFIILLDRKLNVFSKRSVGLGLILRKKESI